MEITTKRLKKWRPPLATLLGVLVLLVLVLPLFAMAYVVILSRSPEVLFASLVANWGKIFITILGISVIASVTAYVIWRGLARPLEALARSANNVATEGGDFDTSAPFGTREVANLALSFETMVEQLQKRAHYVRTLSSHLTHELKSPLTAIKGAAELLHENWTEMNEEQRARFLKNIAEDADRLSRLSNDLRELAKADMAAGGQRLSNFSEVIGALQNDFPQLFFQHNKEDLPLVALSPECLNMALHHLCSNALAHEAKTITVELINSNALKVSNDGQAIKAETVDQIFEPFFTTRRQSNGTGLGLSIVQSLLSSEGWKISLIKANPVAFLIELNSASH